MGNSHIGTVQSLYSYIKNNSLRTQSRILSPVGLYANAPFALHQFETLHQSGIVE